RAILALRSHSLRRPAKPARLRVARPHRPRVRPSMAARRSLTGSSISMFGIVAVVLVALAFDYTNGFHDAANSIATVVSTRVLSPRLAVAWAAFFNFAAFALGKIAVLKIVFGTHVASTIAK